MDYSFIQLYNKDHDPFYSELLSGYTCWTLPEGTLVEAVKYITHLTDSGDPYYENILSGEVSWSLPNEMTNDAILIVQSLQAMDRAQIEAAIDVYFEEHKSQEQTEALDAYVDRVAEALENGVPLENPMSPSSANPPLPDMSYDTELADVTIPMDTSDNSIHSIHSTPSHIPFNKGSVNSFLFAAVEEDDDDNEADDEMSPFKSMQPPSAPPPLPSSAPPPMSPPLSDNASVGSVNTKGSMPAFPAPPLPSASTTAPAARSNSFNSAAPEEIVSRVPFGSGGGVDSSNNSVVSRVSNNSAIVIPPQPKNAPPVPPLSRTTSNNSFHSGVVSPRAASPASVPPVSAPVAAPAPAVPPPAAPAPVPDAAVSASSASRRASFAPPAAIPLSELMGGNRSSLRQSSPVNLPEYAAAPADARGRSSSNASSTVLPPAGPPPAPVPQPETRTTRSNSNASTVPPAVVVESRSRSNSNSSFPVVPPAGPPPGYKTPAASSSTGGAAQKRLSNASQVDGNDSDEPDKEDDEEEDEDVPVRQSESNRASRVSMSVKTMKTIASMKRTMIKSGSLMKLAMVSGRNWKSRHFILNPYNLAYYESAKAAPTGPYPAKPKGEVIVTEYSTVEVDPSVDKKYGFGFRFSNATDSMTLAASSEQLRTEWIDALKKVIVWSRTYRPRYMTLLQTVTKKSGMFSSATVSSVVGTPKFFILSPGLLTYHPDHKTTTEIEGLVNINEDTDLEAIDEEKYILTVVDSDSQHSRISVQFVHNGVEDANEFRVWRAAIEKDAGKQFPGKVEEEPEEPQRIPTPEPEEEEDEDEVKPTKTNNTSGNAAKKLSFSHENAFFGNVSDNDDEDDEVEEPVAAPAKPLPSRNDQKPVTVTNTSTSLMYSEDGNEPEDDEEEEEDDIPLETPPMKPTAAVVAAVAPPPPPNSNFIPLGTNTSASGAGGYDSDGAISALTEGSSVNNAAAARGFHNYEEDGGKTNSSTGKSKSSAMAILTSSADDGTKGMNALQRAQYRKLQKSMSTGSLGDESTSNANNESAAAGVALVSSVVLSVVSEDTKGMNALQLAQHRKAKKSLSSGAPSVTPAAPVAAPPPPPPPPAAAVSSVSVPSPPRPPAPAAPSPEKSKSGPSPSKNRLKFRSQSLRMASAAKIKSAEKHSEPSALDDEPSDDNRANEDSEEEEEEEEVVKKPTRPVSLPLSRPTPPTAVAPPAKKTSTAAAAASKAPVKKPVVAESDTESEKNSDPEDNDTEKEESEQEEEDDNRNSHTFRASMSAHKLKSIRSLKKTAIKSGTLMKLAMVSGRNWKSRYFVLNPYNLAYYTNDSVAEGKPKGEMLITADSTLEIDETVDKKYGNGFKFSNTWETMTLAAKSDQLRAEWMKSIQSIISYSSRYLREYLSLLTTVNKKSLFGSETKTVVSSTKYFIMSPGLLTWHPDHKTTSEVEGVMNLTEDTQIELFDDQKYIITLVDSDPNRTRVSFQFSNNSINDTKTYFIWKEFIQRETGPAEEEEEEEDEPDETEKPAKAAASRPVSTSSALASAIKSSQSGKPTRPLSKQLSFSLPAEFENSFFANVSDEDDEPAEEAEEPPTASHDRVSSLAYAEYDVDEYLANLKLDDGEDDDEPEEEQFSDADVPPDMGRFSLGKDSMDTGGVVIGKMYQEAKNKPLVRVVFENYCNKKDHTLNCKALQELSYDFGVYVTYAAMCDSLKNFVSTSNKNTGKKGGDVSMNYDDFMVWWRTNQQLSTLKLSDPLVICRSHATALFKARDPNMTGMVDISDFNDIHLALIEEKLIPKTTKFLDSLKLLSTEQTGEVYFLEYIAWIDELNRPRGPKSKMKRIMGKIKNAASGGGSSNSSVTSSPASSLNKFLPQRASRSSDNSNPSRELPFSPPPPPPPPLTARQNASSAPNFDFVPLAVNGKTPGTAAGGYDSDGVSALTSDGGTRENTPNEFGGGVKSFPNFPEEDRNKPKYFGYQQAADDDEEEEKRESGDKFAEETRGMNALQIAQYRKSIKILHKHRPTSKKFEVDTTVTSVPPPPPAAPAGVGRPMTLKEAEATSKRLLKELDDIVIDDTDNDNPGVFGVNLDDDDDDEDDFRPAPPKPSQNVKSVPQSGSAPAAPSSPASSTSTLSAARKKLLKRVTSAKLSVPASLSAPGAGTAVPEPASSVGAKKGIKSLFDAVDDYEADDVPVVKPVVTAAPPPAPAPAVVSNPLAAGPSSSGTEFVNPFARRTSIIAAPRADAAVAPAAVAAPVPAPAKPVAPAPIATAASSANTPAPASAKPPPPPAGVRSSIYFPPSSQTTAALAVGAVGGSALPQAPSSAGHPPPPPSSNSSISSSASGARPPPPAAAKASTGAPPAPPAPGKQQQQQQQQPPGPPARQTTAKPGPPSSGATTNVPSFSNSSSSAAAPTTTSSTAAAPPTSSGTAFSPVKTKPLTSFQPFSTSSGEPVRSNLDFILDTNRTLAETNSRIQQINNPSAPAPAKSADDWSTIFEAEIQSFKNKTETLHSGSSAAPAMDPDEMKMVTYQLLLKMRKAIGVSLTSLQEAEQKAMERIRIEEEASRKRIEEAQQASMKEVHNAEEALKRQANELNQRAANDALALNHMLKQLEADKRAANNHFKHQMDYATQIAREMSKHQVKLMSERRHLLKQRLQLDVTLQSINEAHSAVRRAASPVVRNIHHHHHHAGGSTMGSVVGSVDELMSRSLDEVQASEEPRITSETAVSVPTPRGSPDPASPAPSPPPLQQSNNQPAQLQQLTSNNLQVATDHHRIHRHQGGGSHHHNQNGGIVSTNNRPSVAKQEQRWVSPKRIVPVISLSNMLSKHHLNDENNRYSNLGGGLYRGRDSSPTHSAKFSRASSTGVSSNGRGGRVIKPFKL